MKKFYFLLVTLALFSACSSTNKSTPQTESRIDLLEKRIFSLENQRLRAIAELREQTEAFIEKIENEIKSFQKAQRFFLLELDQIKEDIALTTKDNEITQERSHKNQLQLAKMAKKLGNQIIALNELKVFFRKNIDLNDNRSKDSVAYNTALSFYREKKFAVADQKFKEFRQTFPQSSLVDDATYLLAYMQFLKGNYEKSALKFHEMIEQHPHSNKINEAKWWLGVSFERTGDINAAVDIYKSLLELPPENRIRIKAELRLEEISLGN